MSPATTSENAGDAAVAAMSAISSVASTTAVAAVAPCECASAGSRSSCAPRTSECGIEHHVRVLHRELAGVDINAAATGIASLAAVTTDAGRAPSIPSGAAGRAISAVAAIAAACSMRALVIFPLGSLVTVAALAPRRCCSPNETRTGARTAVACLGGVVMNE
jgi:hypothetical protein